MSGLCNREPEVDPPVQRRHIRDDVTEVMLTPEQADAICETLIEMAVKLPMKHRNHYDALVMLGWEPYGSD